MYFKLLPVGEVMPSLSLPQAGTREAQDAVRGFGFRVWDFGFGGSDLFLLVPGFRVWGFLKLGIAFVLNKDSNMWGLCSVFFLF